MSVDKNYTAERAASDWPVALTSGAPKIFKSLLAQFGGWRRRRITKKMTVPPTRPLEQTLVLSAVVIGTAALGAVVLWAATGWLWLVVHQGLH